MLALPNTDSEGAIKLAERIRATIEENNWECQGNDMKITISIGISSLHNGNEEDFNDDDTQVTDILRESDRALYFVKQHGRNNVKAFIDLP